MKEKLQSFIKGLLPKNILFLMTVACIGIMGLTYLKADFAVPLRTAVGYVITPLQKGVNRIGTFGSELFQKRMDMNQMQDRIKELEQEVENLQSQISFYQNDSVELERLQKLLDLYDSYQNYEMTGASIIAKEEGSWYQRFTIDKGTNDGIQTGNNVIADGGLVGIVTSANDSFSVVTAIIDDSINVSSMSQTAQELCVVSGDLTLIGDGCMRISQIAADSSIKSGTPIVTSNVSDRYLPGILIGYVKEISMDANQLTKSGYLTPVANFKTLKDVLVILGTKETTTGSGQ